jgi:hypothetical protein
MVKSLVPSLGMAPKWLGGRAALAEGHSGQSFIRTRI